MKSKNGKKELLMITLTKGVELYLSNLEVEGKSPRYIKWLADRLKYFKDYYHRIDPDAKLTDLELEDGREYLRSLMARDHKYQYHPNREQEPGKLSIAYIHGCGREG